MKKQDLIPIVVIFAIFLAYPTIDRKFISKIFPPKEKPVPAVVETPEASDLPSDTTLSAPEAATEAATKVKTPVEEVAATPEEKEEAPAPDAETIPEVLNTLSNELLELTLSSHGAGVVKATLLDYPLADDSKERVVYDFSGHPAAAAIGYPELAPNAGYEVVEASEIAVLYRKVLPNGLVLNRTLTLDEGYQVRIEDQIENTSSASIALSEYGLQAGFMGNLPGEGKAVRGSVLLGVDTLTGSDSVKYWAGEFTRWFSSEDNTVQQKIVYTGDIPKGFFARLFSRKNKDATPPLSVDWAAVKGKYFTQILTPETSAKEFHILAAYGEPVSSTFLFLFPKTTHPMEKVAASLYMYDYDLGAGQTLTQTATWYMGPKVYGQLKANGPHQEDILQLGFWRPIGTLILKIIIWIQAHIWPYSYGLAIILLTLMIRLIFWPLNHKSMASTRHMQEVQPIIAAMKKKYKDDPKRQQQEMMAIYKEHKINPMGGCLPMLVQIPVFFALFVVLRGAIEMRFSSFLWISDLSTPENLFADVLPIPLNILPIFMGVTMWLQQKMTPTSDPQQQKMMMMMPVLFTFMFYSFPSGLSLYWSVNQVMMIFQLAWMKKFHPPLPLKK